nr:uroporphyrinogen-III C-methyltransferase [Marinobacter sp. X15-166B]
MTDSTDSNSQLPVTVTPPAASARRLWPLWVAIGVILVLTIVLALWNWQQWQSRQSLDQTLAHLQQDTTRLEQQLNHSGSDRNERLRSLEQALANQRQQLNDQQRQIEHTARELLEAGNRSRTDWLLAEAEYLIRVANQRLSVEKDIGGTLAALQAADQVLVETDDVGVFPVRKQLAKDILALKAVADVDRTGLYLSLEAAIEEVHAITEEALIHERAPGFVSTAPGNEPLAEAADTITSAWSQFKHTLQNVVVVRRLDEPAKPLLSPDQSAYARLNMQLMLEQAEAAVLRANQPLYDRALAKAQAALSQWYDGSDSRIQALQATLADLASRAVDPELPDISQSLTLLKARLAGGNPPPADADSSNASDEGERP